MTIATIKIALLSLMLFSEGSVIAADNPPQRYYMSEDKLRLFCTPESASDELMGLSRALCQNYVLGVVDGHDAWTGISKNPNRAFCLPEGTFNAQLTDAVIAELKSQSPSKDGIGAFLVLASLHKAFPCKVDSK